MKQGTNISLRIMKRNNIVAALVFLAVCAQLGTSQVSAIQQGIKNSI